MRKVRNVREVNGMIPKNGLYCGRGSRFYNIPHSKWGNPIKIGDVWYGEKVDRDNAVDIFEYMLLRGQLDFTVEDIKREIPQDVILYCHCAPMRCHCDIIDNARKGVYNEEIHDVNGSN